MKGNSRKSSGRRTGVISPSHHSAMSIDVRRKLLADFCKLVAARQNVATRSTKVEANLSSGQRSTFDLTAIRKKRPATLPFNGTVAASFVDEKMPAGVPADLHPDTPASRAEQRAPDPDVRALSPRLLQTLDGLLKGESEKQIALHLAISQHTVHAYVKMLYRRYGASSRGELLARWVQRGDRSAPSRLP